MRGMSCDGGRVDTAARKRAPAAFRELTDAQYDTAVVQRGVGSLSVKCAELLPHTFVRHWLWLCCPRRVPFPRPPNLRAMWQPETRLAVGSPVNLEAAEEVMLWVSTEE